MKIKHLLIFVLTAATAASAAFAAALQRWQLQPMLAQVISEDAGGVTAQFEFQRPQLRAMDEGEDGVRLWIDLPNATLDFDTDGPAEPVITRLIAVPDGFDVRAEVVGVDEWRLEAEAVVSRDALERQVRRTAAREIPPVMVGEAGWMRTMRVAPVAIRPARFDAGEHIVFAAERMTVRFEFIPTDDPPVTALDPERYRSLAFDELFRALLLNPGALPNVMPTGSIIRRGSYLIITDSALASACGELVQWKKAKGFNVVVAPIYRPGIHADDIKAYIRDAFYNWERPVEFVLLVGDVNQVGIELPSYLTQNPKDREEYDVTDQPYVELVGDDYFPDAFIGRMSTDSPAPSDLRRQILRVVDYEKSIVDFDWDNFRRATLFAGNFGESGRRVLSPVETVRWLGERLGQFGYDQIEEFYYRSGNDNISSDPIVRSINRGVNIVGYRGWADANGTHYPQFYIADLRNLTNEQPLPVMTFFVCNTGDFGNPRVNPCFGEESVRQGTFRRPTAGLSFFGPSDLQTSTLYNNPIFAGYYTGLMYENLRNLAALTLRGKMEVWRSMVHQRGYNAENNFVQFYFYCYNILSDPDLNIYFTAPTRIAVDHPNELFVGDTRMRVRVTNQADGRPIYGALVNLAKGDETDISALTDHNGEAWLPMNLASEGELQLTVIGHQLTAYQTTLSVGTAGRMVSLREVRISDPDGSGLLVAGVPLELNLVLANTGNSPVSDVRAVISTPLESVTITDAEVQFGDIAVGASAAGQTAVGVRIDPSIYPYTAVPFILDIRDGAGNSWQALARLAARSGRLFFESYSFPEAVINPGETDDLTVSLANYGPLDLSDLRGELETFDQAVEILSGSSLFGDAAAGERISNSGAPFRIRALDGTWNGRRVAMRLAMFDGDGRLVNRVFFNITIGRQRPADPIGPDAYGYFIYENSDADRYDDKPVYNWIELDPNYGGQGAEHHEVKDDSTFTMDLPFTFRYYGEDYDRISICSNGWFSFEETWMWNFRNWQLPSPLGPHALVAPFWDDLVGTQINDSTRGNLHIYTRYDQNEARFIIEWSRAIARTTVADAIETFQAILYDPARHNTPTGDGEIVFQYQDVQLVERSESNYATVGMEDWFHRRGLMLTYAGIYEPGADTLRPERAIKITTVRPDEYLAADPPAAVQPVKFGLEPAFPNPFNAVTRVRFSLDLDGAASVLLYDLSGRVVLTAASGRFKAGAHSVTVDASTLPTGLYILRLETAKRSAAQRLLLLK